MKASKNKGIEAKGEADSKEEEELQHVWRRRRGFAKRKEDGLAKGGM
jgi:hypothetical protein